MNTFGRAFRVHIWGESHGPSVGVLVDGCPPGIPLTPDDLAADLDRRRGGRPGTTTRVEPDTPSFDSGVFQGHTTGSPIAIRFGTQDARPGAYTHIRHTPRPGHADLVAHHRFGGYADPRGGGHFSGRLTVGLVAAGAIARRIITPTKVEARLLEVGGSADIEGALAAARAAGDSAGGLLACEAAPMPRGLGEPFFDSLEGLISQAVFAIPGIKGIEFGAGFACASMQGSECNDAILDLDGRCASNRAGGITGGISTGMPLTLRVAVKPTPSIAKPQATVDLRDGSPATVSTRGRHDSCIALRMPVIVEAAVALVLADLVMLRRLTPGPLDPDI